MADASGYRDRGLGDHRRHSNHKRTRGEDEHELDDVKRVKRRYDDYEKGSGSRYEHQYDDHRHSRRRDSVSRPNTSSLREGRGEHRTNSTPFERSPSMSSARRRHHTPDHHRHHRRRHSSTPPTHIQIELPLGARPLVRSDLKTFKPLFAQYLEVQKGKDIAALDEREVKGRWKSFVGKWNRGELAEGWYSPETLSEARKAGAGASTQLVGEGSIVSVTSPSSRPSGQNRERLGGGNDLTLSGGEESENEDDDEYGPTLPGSAPAQSYPRHHSDATRSTRHGPGIPNRQDLDLQREKAEEERTQHISDLRLARKADRVEQRARLEELVPRAEPGTRERQLEKKREVNEKMRGFRDKSPGGGAAEVNEAELMGGGDSVAEYKRLKAAAERRKTEREVRREEEARIKAAEREDRVREYRRKEDVTMEVLKRIARERFGSG
ncbi:hypothetical protein F5Y00DRAFT_245361 [Daldinia vernicosa]|uniref:uncharacterized protein n=1 Tax=Daldinia vernicosa TaxID=114800 RepID=UPI0020089E08|nr:uncharacterized protein F5Y00DRAFT_245361 [Daldinia vernicosa]KAI0845806.1 hypothetical protein F5Y00DRAFT_245361 [Daldinia vernicosa]